MFVLQIKAYVTTLKYYHLFGLLGYIFYGWRNLTAIGYVACAAKLRYGKS